MSYLLKDELKDIFHAEQQLVKALPKAIQAAATSTLQKALEFHLEETKGHVERLKEVFALLNTTARSKSCAAMEGLVHECQELLGNYESSFVRDAGLISKCQRIEHYEIATYSSLLLFAQEMELDRIADLLQATLKEEIQANHKLTKLLEGGILYSGITEQALAES